MRFVIFLLLFLPEVAVAWAPTGAITIVLPFQPSGASGQVAYMLKSELAARGVPSVVLHKPGALGAVGHKYLADSSPDGMTIGLITTAGLESTLYDKNDFYVVSTLGNQSFMLVANKKHPAKLKPFLLAATQSGAKFGLVNAAHELGLSSVLLAAGLNGSSILRVPYKSGTQLYVDLSAGDIDFTFGATPGVIAFVNSGRVAMLGVSTPDRLLYFKDVPALRETFPNFKFDSFMMVATPAGVSSDAKAFYKKLFRSIVYSSEVGDFLYGSPIHMSKR
jgi:tripartite-type tricarboxylate transporter receptor subunit TctC